MSMHPYPPSSFSLDPFKPYFGAKQQQVGALSPPWFSLGSCTPSMVPSELQQQAVALGRQIS
eukprot:2862517-Pyramimonas_sp.AAC.1